MDCLERAVSFGVDPKELKFSDTHCMDLPCFEDCPVIAKYKMTLYVHQGLSIPESKTKWDMVAKQDFVYDYNKLEIEEICRKYNITQRTATEYNKNFVREI
ncbi:MAG TPA: hypothetical protein DC057_04900 [Spirochaetia bacterium]|nr:hypothetical protein [Spirochaetia bacterium]